MEAERPVEAVSDTETMTDLEAATIAHDALTDAMQAYDRDPDAALDAGADPETRKRWELARSRFRSSIARMRANEVGQTMAEYAVVLAVITVAIITTLALLSGQINTLFSSVITRLGG